MSNKPGNTLTLDMSAANQQLRDLLNLATDNQEKIDRIHSAELELLQSESLPELFDYLFNDHTMLFQLLSVDLQLIDHDFRVKRLLAETDDGRRFDQHLKLLTDNEAIERLKDLGTHPILAAYDTEEHEWLLTGSASNVQSIAILPLIRHSEIIGIAICTSADKERFQPDLGTDLLRRLAAILAISIENAVNHHHLQYLGLTDALTGVRNRRFLDQRLSEEVLQAMHSQKPLSFLFVDIDYFKKINDTHGHQTGDKVLVKVAGLIYSHLRAADILSRYGGEEFAVLLKGLNMSEATQIAERIRTTIAEASITSDNKTIPVTVSIGVAELTKLASDSDDANQIAYALTQAADAALYQAKEDGRNRVVLAEPGPG